MKTRNLLEDPLARRSKKQTRPTRPARSRGTGVPARLTVKRLEQVVAEVLGGDYAVAPVFLNGTALMYIFFLELKRL